MLLARKHNKYRRTKAGNDRKKAREEESTKKSINDRPMIEVTIKIPILLWPFCRILVFEPGFRLSSRQIVDGFLPSCTAISFCFKPALFREDRRILSSCVR